ncbi:MAG: DoxX family protein [Pseudomonas sp.]
MQPTFVDGFKDPLILLARILLSLLFIISGWLKLTGFSGTVAYISSLGAPLPTVAAAIAVVMELGGGIAILLGLFTRPIALLFVPFVLGTALLGHQFWTMQGMERTANEINFYKNLGLIAAFMLLAVTGSGRFALDKGK